MKDQRVQINEHICKLTYQEANSFVKRWHYTGCMPHGLNVCYGLFLDGALYAVIVYGNGGNPYLAKFIGKNSVMELTRMCRVEPAQKYYLSRFIRQTMKMLSQELDFEAIVAYADPDQGHSGGVYKATGFVMHGKTQPEYHVIDASGKKRHRKFIHNAAKRFGVSADKARTILGATQIKTIPKIRWVLEVASDSYLGYP